MDYYKYINSAAWKQKSIKWIKETGKCENCEKTGYLECHHLHYDTLGFETRKDVKVLCINCHRVADYNRKNNTNLTIMQYVEMRLSNIRKK